MKPRIYVDTHGASRGFWRRAPDGVRVALHLEDGTIVEMWAGKDGDWRVSQSHAQRGGYEDLARGSVKR